MQGLNYKRLDGISNSVSPYRGSLNRFPIGDRRHNHKYFFVRDDDGQRVFDIVHGQNWKHITLTEAEHDECAKQGMPRLNKYQDHNTKKWEYYRYEVSPNILGVVRPDNTFEFTGESYGQGDRGIMSSWSYGWFSTESRRGGMIWSSKTNGGIRIIPIYQGMRIDCETIQPTKPITVVGRKVDRKVGKNLLAGYESFYMTTEVMTKAMDYEVFVKTMLEVVSEHVPDNDFYLDHKVYTSIADKLIDTAPLDSAMLYIFAWDIGNMRWNLRRFSDTNFSRYSAHEDTPHTMFLNLKRRLNKEVYKANKKVFKKVEYVNGEMYPPSEWGYTVMVDGVEVKQYD